MLIFQILGKSSANIDKLVGELILKLLAMVTSNAKNDKQTLLYQTNKRSLDNVADSDVQVKVLKGVVAGSLSDKMLAQNGITTFNFLKSVKIK